MPKIVKDEILWTFSKSSLLQNIKNIEDIKIFSKKINENSEQSHNAETCKRCDPLRFLKIQFIAKYQKH